MSDHKELIGTTKGIFKAIKIVKRKQDKTKSLQVQCTKCGAQKVTQIWNFKSQEMTRCSACKTGYQNNGIGGKTHQNNVKNNNTKLLQYYGERLFELQNHKIVVNIAMERLRTYFNIMAFFNIISLLANLYRIVFIGNNS
jgi:hypothetical protein